MEMYQVTFTYDGEKLRGASGLTREGVHKMGVDLPVDRWISMPGDSDPCDLIDLVVEQLACFSDNLATNNKRLRRKREQGALFDL